MDDRPQRRRLSRLARRRFLAQSAGALLLGLASSKSPGSQASTAARSGARLHASQDRARPAIRLFLCGDVMTGRGIDQIMAHPGDPQLHERSVRDARTYVAIAEKASGPIPKRVDPGYIWGDALADLDRLKPDGRIVNLETAVTTSTDAWFGKSIHYRMNPANVACLMAAKIDCCTLANNHVLDWGYEGLRETLATLHDAGIRTAGAGDNEAMARAPAVIDVARGGRALVFAYGSRSAGVPVGWAARSRRAGISELDETDPRSLDVVAESIRLARQPGDIVVASIHWGGNWGYDVSGQQREFAQSLIDRAGADIVFGHSSHHPRPIEVHAGKLILHGCGDLLNDYEGIRGHQEFRPELGFMYLPDVDATTGRLQALTLVPVRIRRFRVNRASAEEAAWLRDMLDREGRAFGTSVRPGPDGTLLLHWDSQDAVG